MYVCCVPDCKDRVSPRHCFPLYHEQIFNIWLERVGNINLQAMNHEKVYKSYRVCGRHFSSFCKVPGTKKLKFGSLPTLFLPNFHEEPTEQNSVFRYPTELQNTSITIEKSPVSSPACKRRKSNQQSEKINKAYTSQIELIKIDNGSSVNIIYYKPHYGQVDTQRLFTSKDDRAKNSQKLNCLINATRSVDKHKSENNGERSKHVDNLEIVSQNDCNTTDNIETLKKSILLEAYKLENNLRDVVDADVLKHVAKTLKSENELLTINCNSMNHYPSKMKSAEPPNKYQKQFAFNSAKKRCLIKQHMYKPSTKEISNTKNISFSQKKFISNSVKNDHNYI